MPNFEYTAHQKNGEIQRGTIEASDRAAALATLRSKDLQPIIIKEAKGGHGLNMEINLPGLNKVKSKDLVIFTRQLSTLVDAGVPLLRSLTLLKDQTESLPLKHGLNEIVSDIQAGSNLSDALSKHPDIFSPIYVNMVRAGETGGILDTVLDRLAYQQEKDSALKSKIRGAMMYPTVIFSVTIVAFIILMTFIVPKIGAVLSSLSNGKASLPIYTKILLDISNGMKNPKIIIPIIIILPLAIVIFRRYKKTPKGRYKWHSFLLKIPVLKVLIVKTAVARFARIFASLMSAGVSIVEAINTTAGAIGNAVIEKELLDSAKAVEAGGQLSSELAKSEHFPPIVIQMLAVGEETGTTDTIILKVADFYEQEVDTAVEALSSVIEPITIILLGAMVGIIVISVYGPITKVSTSVSG